MHLYLITRGIKKQTDEFIKQLQGKYVPFEFYNKNVESETPIAGKKYLRNVNCQISVRPIQLWEIVFPKVHKDVVLTTCLGKSHGKTNQLWHQKVLWTLRKLLHIEPVPEYIDTQQMPIERENIECIGVGVKDDYWTDCETSEHVEEKDKKPEREYFEGL